MFPHSRQPCVNTGQLKTSYIGAWTSYSRKTPASYAKTMHHSTWMSYARQQWGYSINQGQANWPKNWWCLRHRLTLLPCLMCYFNEKSKCGSPGLNRHFKMEPSLHENYLARMRNYYDNDDIIYTISALFTRNWCRDQSNEADLPHSFQLNAATIFGRGA